MSSEVASPPQAPPRRGWWSRNWLWVVPVGCLVPLLVCCGVPAAILLYVVNSTKASEVYKEAVAKAKASDQVKAVLGEPIQEGFWAGGSVTESNGTGNANMVISISGPKGGGTIFADAHRADGKWKYDRLDVEFPGTSTPRVNLLAKEEPPQKKDKTP